MAKNRQKTGAKRKAPRTAFKPGQCGNPKGRPKIAREVVESARAHTPQALATLVRMMNGKKTPAAVRVRAAEALLDRGWGRPTQAMEMTGRNGEALPATEVVVNVGQPAPELTPEQWLKLHGVDLKEIANGLGPAAGAANKRAAGKVG